MRLQADSLISCHDSSVVDKLHVVALAPRLRPSRAVSRPLGTYVHKFQSSAFYRKLFQRTSRRPRPFIRVRACVSCAYVRLQGFSSLLQAPAELGMKKSP